MSLLLLTNFGNGLVAKLNIRTLSAVTLKKKVFFPLLNPYGYYEPQELIRSGQAPCLVETERRASWLLEKNKYNNVEKKFHFEFWKLPENLTDSLWITTT